MRNAMIGSFLGFVLAAILVAACGSGSSVADVTALEQRVGALEQNLTTAQADLAQAETDVATCLGLLQHVSCVGNDIYVTGANLHVVNGEGDTSLKNGLGNVIIGYNEERGGGADLRTGSHMLVVGARHNYSMYGGIVVGYQNTVSGGYASVSGGKENTASAWNASVSGGLYNTASGNYASVSGGSENTAGDFASVSGGRHNTASGRESSVSGGRDNTASGGWSSLSGGNGNTASGDYDHPDTH